MNKINKFSIFLFIVATTMLFSSCKKDYIKSKATFWPDIKINGSSTVVITEGDESFTDPGAVVTVNGNPISFDTDNNVDYTTPGVYSITYSAANEDGITASQTRVVIVVPVSAVSIPDFTGDFTLTTPSRPSPVPTMEVSSLGSNVYYSSNIYGSNGSNTVLTFPAYFYTTNGTNVTFLSGPYVENNNFCDGGTATWNPVTKRLACTFTMGHAAPGTIFSRTWTHN
ncbi:MAG: DUF5011 domain-containing protein [Chitinophagales bacterium]|jgi:hypothetical protein|nr:DUF5011 domain-containing protein [Bacteroidota bacterium]